MPTVKTIRRVSDLVPDKRNANKGTERGNQLLEHSLRSYGAGRSVLADRNGNLIAGNKTVEKAVELGIDDAVVVKTNGKQLVVVQRTDLDINSKAARELAIADNRVGEVDLAWDAETMRQLSETLDMTTMFTEVELAKITAEDIPPIVRPSSLDDQGKLDEEELVKCPKCGHEFKN